MTGTTDTTTLFERAQKGLKYLIFFQTASKVITFVLNILILRQVSRATFGASHTFTNLFVNTSLFLAREACRRTCVRTAEEEEEEEEKKGKNTLTELQTNNLIWATTLLGWLLTFVVGSLFFYFAPEEEKGLEGYSTTMGVFVVAVLIELTTEVFYIFFQKRLLFKERVLIEGFSLFLKCCATFLLLLLPSSSPSLPLISFAVGQLSYSLSLLLLYLGYFSKQKKLQAFYPNFSISPTFSSPHLKVFSRFEWQTVQKLVLTQGENVVLRYFVTLEDRGDFGVINNLGSLVVRFFFHPFEEVAFTLFSRVGGGLGEESKKRKKEDDEFLLVALRNSLKLMTIVAFVFTFFAPNYSSLLLRLLFGSLYSSPESASLLSLYCVYVGLLGVNGITEAFVHALATPSQLSILNLFLLISSFLSLFVSVWLVGLVGSGGILLGNCIIIGLRVGVSGWFVRMYFGESESRVQVKDFFPSVWVWLAGVVGWVGTRTSGQLFGDQGMVGDLEHVLVGALLFGLFLLTIFKTEKDFIRSIRTVLSKKKEKI